MQNIFTWGISLTGPFMKARPIDSTEYPTKNVAKKIMKYSSSMPIAAPATAMMPHRRKVGMGEMMSRSGIRAKIGFLLLAALLWKNQRSAM